MFSGSMVALVTPMHTDGAVDWDSLEQLIEWHIQSGTDAIVSVGTTGESATLNFDEHKAVIRFTVEMVKKRVPVIAGAGGNATREAIELTFSAYHGGCDATLQVTPYYNKPPQRGLYTHFEQVAHAVPLPVILYNVPGRTGCDLLPETTAALAKIKNIVGIKEATPLTRLRELLPLFPRGGDFKIFSGEDGICCEAANEGLIDGVISVTANLAPAQMSAMMRHALKGEAQAANAINDSLAALHTQLFVEANPIPAKWAMQRMDKIQGGIRLPLVPFAETHQAPMEAALRQAGLI